MKYNAYYNGNFCDKSEVKIPLSDRAAYFGDGVYDAVLGKGGKCFLLKEHLMRLESNVQAIGLSDRIDTEELIAVIDNLTNDIKGAFFLYIQMSRAGAERSHSYPDGFHPNLLVTVTERTSPSPDATLKLISVPDIRYLMCNIKTINLLPAVLASKEAERRGADEAVFHRGDIVTECAHSNVHIIKNGVLITHPTGPLILPGIERAHTLKVCRELDIEYAERPFTLAELRGADEVLVTSTTKLGERAILFDDSHYELKEESVGNLICKKMMADFEKNTDFSL